MDKTLTPEFEIQNTKPIRNPNFPKKGYYVGFKNSILDDRSGSRPSSFVADSYLLLGALNATRMTAEVK
jgi:hypothetical protein